MGSDGLFVRGAQFLGGLPDLASWRLLHDRELMCWERLDPEIVNDAHFHTNFLKYKLARTQLRRRISAAMAQMDFDVAGALLDFWESGWGFHSECTTPEQELRLNAGRFFVPGACVVHRRFGYRAVVLGCEPWVRAPLARRLSAQEREASGAGMYRLQPLYCVLADDRDVSGGGALFVPETDLEPSKDVFPIRSRHKGRLLEEHETIQAYLPGAALKQAARRQHLGMPFTLQGA
jgi:hemimethylated DNA binding protein